MRAAPYVVAYIIAAACLFGIIDRRSAEVTHDTAMDAPRPVFESRAELLSLHMPCTYMKVGPEHEPIRATNTRCTKADRRDE